MRNENFSGVTADGSSGTACANFHEESPYSDIKSMTLAQLIEKERLPADFNKTVDRYYRPLAERLADWAKPGPQLIGINGGQGTGKSTMALFLKHLLEGEYGLKVAVLSVDDLYLTQADRVRLGELVHPLLVTRGVPGTHDPKMGLRVIEGLMSANPDTLTPLPRFNKGVDDRVPFEDWPVFQGRADIVILEGWCVGATEQAADELVEPINQLERNEDPDGKWRGYVNQQLAGDYRLLFDRIDQLIMLRAPSMACIRTWRGEQEVKLRKKLEAEGKPMDGVMDDQEIDRFIEHYQRLTEHQWRVFPDKAAAVLRLAADHKITGIDWKEGVA